MHAIFMDFKRAYNWINRDFTFQAMDGLGIPKQLIQLVGATLSGSESNVKING